VRGWASGVDRWHTGERAEVTDQEESGRQVTQGARRRMWLIF
jgi:hypothetical protein